MGRAQLGSQYQCAAGMHAACPRGCVSARPCVVAAATPVGVWRGLICYCRELLPGGCGKGKCVATQKAEEVALMGQSRRGFCWSCRSFAVLLCVTGEHQGEGSGGMGSWLSSGRLCW